MIIAVDFDGTIVEHKYPKIGSEIPFATDTLKMLIKDGHQLILWSVREGELLQEAVDWCHERGVDFWAVNKDYPEEEKEKNNHFSRKLKVEMFIDDRNLGRIPCNLLLLCGFYRHAFRHKNPSILLPICNTTYCWI